MKVCRIANSQNISPSNKSFNLFDILPRQIDYVLKQKNDDTPPSSLAGTGNKFSVSTTESVLLISCVYENKNGSDLRSKVSSFSFCRYLSVWPILQPLHKLV